MNGRRSKSIRRAVQKEIMKDTEEVCHEYWNVMCSRRLRLRIKYALQLLFRVRRGEAK